MKLAPKAVFLPFIIRTNGFEDAVVVEKEPLSLFHIGFKVAFCYEYAAIVEVFPVALLGILRVFAK